MNRAFFFAGLCCLLVGVGDTPTADRNLHSTSRAQSLTHFVDELALAPDGSHLVYAGSRGSHSQLYLRRMNPPGESRPIPGTDGAGTPFFSPDGQWIGFFARAKLQKVAVSGGLPVTLCAAQGHRGASWGPDDTIVFTLELGNLGLRRVPGAGGTPKSLTKVETERGEGTHLWPEILPGGKAVLFTIGLAGKPYDEAQIAVLSLETGERRVVLEGGSDAHYAPTGHIIYFREDKLWAAPFDLARLQVTGPPAPIVENVSGSPSVGEGLFSFSQNGLLVYVPRDARRAERTLVWVNRKGEERPVTKTRRAYCCPRLSPEGRRLAVSVSYDHIWVYDLEGETFTQITSDESSDVYPVWTPDGHYDVAPDDQRFLMIKEPAPAPVEEQLRTVPNWFEELKRHVPHGTR